MDCDLSAAEKWKTYERARYNYKKVKEHTAVLKYLKSGDICDGYTCFEKQTITELINDTEKKLMKIKNKFDSDISKLSEYSQNLILNPI